MNNKPFFQIKTSMLRLVILIPVFVGLLLIGAFAETPPQKRTTNKTAEIELKPAIGYAPNPKSFDIKDLGVPDWYQLSYTNPAIRFQTDLDLLAPMGTGSQNAARFFRLFSQPDGSRRAEFKKINASKTTHPEWGDILPVDDPLVEEAKPWADQSVMRFYPDYYSLNGSFTEIPNLLLPILLARTWTSMGVESSTKSKGLNLCRRAIRLGRLLRQEDITIISDVIGLLCIQTGAKGIYKIAMREGNIKLAFLASIVLGEVAPQASLSNRKFDKTTFLGAIQEKDNQERKLLISEKDLNDLITIAKEDTNRRFRLEAIGEMNFIRHLCDSGDSVQKVREALSELSKSNDPMISQSAQWSLEYTLSESDLKEHLESYYPWDWENDSDQ